MLGTPCAPPNSGNVLPLICTYLIKSQGRQTARCVYNDKPWMKTQCQACGSYRSGELLEMLPEANTSEESVIVVLDSFSGHLTDEVVAISKKKGHVLIFHGGGITPFMQVTDMLLHQVTDTHLHGILPSRHVRMEFEWSADEQM